MNFLFIISLLFLFIISSNFHQKAIAQEKRLCLFTNGYFVHIMNKLPQNSAPLELHCASKNDDIGNHTLGIDQEIQWGFCESFFANTLFYCDAQWGSKKSHFNAFKSSWNIRCDRGSCFWEARSDGFYLSNLKYDPAAYKKYADWH